MVRGTATIAPGTLVSATADHLRMIIYLDKQANGTSATVTDILQTANINAFNNLFNKERFVILRDTIIDLVAEAGANDGTQDQFGIVQHSFSAFKKCRIPLEFSGATGAIAEIRSNNIGILFISQAGVAVVDYTTRIRFADP